MAGWDERMDFDGDFVKVHNGKILMEVPLQGYALWDTPYYVGAALTIDLNDAFKGGENSSTDTHVTLWLDHKEYDPSDFEDEEEAANFSVRGLDAGDVYNVLDMDKAIQEIMAKTWTVDDLKAKWFEEHGHENGWPFTPEESPGGRNQRPDDPHSAWDVIAQHITGEPAPVRQNKASRATTPLPDSPGPIDLGRLASANDILDLYSQAKAEQDPSKRAKLMAQVRSLSAQVGESLSKRIIDGHYER